MSQRRVLIVDDTPATVDLVSFVLNAAGFAVQSATDVASLTPQLPLFKPNLILMDIQMPGMDGLEMTRRLKAEPETRHIPVIAFTAYAMSGDEAKMRAAGCDGYIAKPFDVATFAATVRSYLRSCGCTAAEGEMTWSKE